MSNFTQGFNALAALSERTISRMLRGRLLAGTLGDAIQGNFDNGAAAGGIHLIPIEVDVDLSVGEIDELLVSMTAECALVLDQVPPNIPIGRDERFRADFYVVIPLQAQEDEVRARLADVNLENIQVNIQATNPLLPVFLVEPLRNELLTVIQRGDLGDFAFVVEPAPPALESTARDVITIEDSTTADRDELVLAYYHAQHPSTRGDSTTLGKIIGTSNSLAVRISTEIIDMLAEDAIRRRFMRYTIRAGNKADAARYQLDYGLTTYATATLVHEIKGLKFEGRADVRVRVRIPKHNWETEFDTNSLGEFTWTPPPGLLASGDLVEFHGIFQRQGKVRVTDFQTQLQDGFIEASGTALMDVACYDNVTVKFRGEINYHLDPADGRLDISAENVSFDAPAKVDALEYFAKGVSWLFTAGIVPGIIESKKEMASWEAKEGIQQAGAGLEGYLPSPSNAEMAVFWEDFTVSSAGLDLQGQIEAGWLRSAGRKYWKWYSSGLMVTVEIDWDIDDQGQRLSQWLTVDIFKNYVFIHRPSRSSDPEDAGSTLEEVYITNDLTAMSPTNLRFEAIDDRDIAHVAFRPNSHWSKLPDSKQVDLGKVAPPKPLLVRTAWGRFAKVRCDVARALGPNYAVRWVTYEQRRASGTIQGEWHRSQDGLRFWGEFNVVLEGLYENHGLDIKWSHEGAGSMTIDADNPRQVSAEFDWDQEPNWGIIFGMTLSASVTDLAGRTVTTSRFLCGSHPDYKPSTPEEEFYRFAEEFLRPSGIGPFTPGEIPELEPRPPAPGPGPDPLATFAFELGRAVGDGRIPLEFGENSRLVELIRLAGKRLGTP